MSTDPLSQTSFSQELPTGSAASVPNTPITPVPKKKNILLPVALVIVAVLLVAILVLVFLVKSGSRNQVRSTPTPLPSQAPVETDQIRKDIEVDLKAIEQSNPEEDEHPFPPVDFTTRIKDPNSK